MPKPTSSPKRKRFLSTHVLQAREVKALERARVAQRRPRERIRLRGFAADTARKMVALMKRAIDEGRSFKVEVTGDRTLLELGPLPPKFPVKP